MTGKSKCRPTGLAAVPPAAVHTMILAAWECGLCDVSGRDPEPVLCWNCGGPVVVTSRVDVSFLGHNR